MGCKGAGERKEWKQKGTDIRAHHFVLFQFNLDVLLNLILLPILFLARLCAALAARSCFLLPIQHKGVDEVVVEETFIHGPACQGRGKRPALCVVRMCFAECYTIERDLMLKLYAHRTGTGRCLHSFVFFI